MTKTEYMTTINEKMTAAEALCADLRKLRILQKLAKDISNAAELVSAEVLSQSITAKETELKAGNSRRLVGSSSTWRRSRPLKTAPSRSRRQLKRPRHPRRQESPHPRSRPPRPPRPLRPLLRRPDGEGGEK